ncbi:MAG: response regulator [Magnetospirillum sp. WYHS-4]
MARILVIDDDPRIRLLIRRILEGDGHAVEEAGNGSAGVDKQCVTPFDLVITDIVMPDQEGVETIRVLKRRFPALPIVAMSGGGGGSLDYLEMARKMGASAVLAKPFTNLDVTGTVSGLLVAT